VINADIISLYKLAYSGLNGFGEFASNDRVIVEVKDSSRFIETDPLKNDNWRRNNTYCYDAVVPPMTEADFCKFMQEDLKRFFPYDIKIEKRKVKLASGKHKRMKMLVIRDRINSELTKKDR
jgi:hypothetical protein